MADIVNEVIVQEKVPEERRVHIAGDVSATNCLMEVFDSENGKTYVKALYNGQTISNFGDVFEHLKSLGEYRDDSIENVVLSPAGPLNPDGTVKMTRAPFTIDAKKVHQPVAVINDYAAKGYAVAVFGLKERLEYVNLRHTNGEVGESVPQGRMVILGPGTGLGCGRLQYDGSAGLYLPLDSEGGHTSAIIDIDSDFEIGVMRFLKRKYGGKIPHNEAICSGPGLVDVLGAIVMFTGVVPLDIEQYKTTEDRAAYIADQAKMAPESIYGRTMGFMWAVYGRELRNKAVHENARGGIWVAGGIPRKNILKDKEVDSKIEGIIMHEFDNGPSHASWVNKIPTKVIMDSEDGLKGAKAVASTPFYMKREKYTPRE